MPSKPGSIKVGYVVQVDPGHDDLFAGVLLVVNEITPFGIQGYYTVPGSADAPREELRVACRAHYETTFKAVTVVRTVAPWTVPDEIFVCPCCAGATCARDIRTCRICERRFCAACHAHVKHKHIEHIPGGYPEEKTDA